MEGLDFKIQELKGLGDKGSGFGVSDIFGTLWR